MQTFPYSIYDAHHHLWDLHKVHYPWLATKGIVRFFGDPAPIQKNYLPADLKADFDHLPVEKTVHIQVGASDEQHLLESQIVQGMSDESGVANAIIAFCQLDNKVRTKQLDELSKLKNFRGIRQIVGRSPEEDTDTGTGALLSNPEWLKGLIELSERSLCFDLQLIPDQMLKAAELIAKVPNLKVALCHCGSPWYLKTQSPDQQRTWEQGISALAALPNVHCKISGLTMFNHDWSTEMITPVIHAVLTAFGAERCMFGSNFPVDKLHANYRDLWFAYLHALDNYQPTLSETQKQALFKFNCKTFYKIN